jgi:hypothetical protein
MEYWVDRHVSVHERSSRAADIDSQPGVTGVGDAGGFRSGDRGHAAEAFEEGNTFLLVRGVVVEEVAAERPGGLALAGPYRLREIAP